MNSRPSRLPNKPRVGIEPTVSSLPMTCSNRLSYLGINKLAGRSVTELYRHFAPLSASYLRPSNKILNTKGIKILCGQGGICTPVDRSREFYRLVRLTAPPPTQNYIFYFNTKILFFQPFLA